MKLSRRWTEEKVGGVRSDEEVDGAVSHDEGSNPNMVVTMACQFENSVWMMLKFTPGGVSLTPEATWPCSKGTDDPFTKQQRLLQMFEGGRGLLANISQRR